MNEMSPTGEEIYRWATELFPICRSLTGEGVRQTLRYFKEFLPDLTIHNVPSGTKAFDWTVPDEWNINDAFIANMDGTRVVDFRSSNLHVVGYSEPIDARLTFAELDQNLYSLPDQPTAIPYITSYYQRRWGFCIAHQQREQLRRNPDGIYHVKIDSTLAPGHLSYGELVLPGSSKEEVLLSTYVCHPSMANNELSGPCVAAALALWLGSVERRYTYRILFLVETIGSILYLSQHLERMKKRVRAGFVLTCLGDNRTYSYLASRAGDTLADRAAKQILSHHAPEYKVYSFLARGSDERQYCSPGADLPVCSIMRSKYGTYPEYHTSLDDLTLISPEGLQGGFDALQKCLQALEENQIFRTRNPCEPQLGPRGLYPNLSTKETTALVSDMMDLIAYADGKNDLLTIAEIINRPVSVLVPVAKKLVAADVFEIVSHE
jgi:aminopeptidase-like protein